MPAHLLLVAMLNLGPCAMLPPHVRITMGKTIPMSETLAYPSTLPF